LEKRWALTGMKGSRLIWQTAMGLLERLFPVFV